MDKVLPYTSYSQYMQSHKGYKIWRVGVDAGFSCPNRDKNKNGLYRLVLTCYKLNKIKFDFTDVLLANTRKIWYIMEE